MENRKNTEVSLGISIRKEHWNETEQIVLTSDPDYKQNSFKVNNVKTKLDKALLLAEAEGTLVITETLIQALNKPSSSSANTSLRSYSNSLILALKEAKKAGTALAYQDAVNSIIKHGKESMLITDVSYSFLERYKLAMLKQGVKLNSISAYLRSIRAIYNKAIKQKIVPRSAYPFDDFKIQIEETNNRRLTIEQMKMLASVDLPTFSARWHYRNFFFMSFCLIGMNFVDMFTLSGDQYDGFYIRYKRHKTGKLYCITVPTMVKNLLDFYSKQSSKNGHKYILPTMGNEDDPIKQCKLIKQICKNCSKHMRKIGASVDIREPISSYYARYTWANIARKLGYSKDLISEALGHEYGNKVTSIYLDKYDTERINEANLSVIKAVWNKEGGC